MIQFLLPWRGDRARWIEHIERLGLTHPEWSLGWAEMTATPTDYARLISLFWGKGADLVIIEHDIFPTAAQLDELTSSARPVVTVPYRMSRAEHPSQWDDGGLSILGEWGCATTVYTGLGLIRFRPEGQPPLGMDFALTPWQHVDREVSRALYLAGVEVGVQWPTVQHGERVTSHAG